MKKSIFVILVFLLVGALLFLGCAEPEPSLYKGTIEDADDIDDEESTISITTEAGEKREFEFDPESTIFYSNEEDEEIGLEELKEAVKRGKVVTSITCFGANGEDAAVISIETQEESALILGTIKDIKDIEEDDEGNLIIFITTEAGHRRGVQLTPRTVFYLEDEEIGLEKVMDLLRQGETEARVYCRGEAGAIISLGKLEETALILGTIKDIEDIEEDDEGNLIIFITTEAGQRRGVQITPRTVFYFEDKEIGLERVMDLLRQGETEAHVYCRGEEGVIISLEKP